MSVSTVCKEGRQIRQIFSVEALIVTRPASWPAPVKSKSIPDAWPRNNFSKVGWPENLQHDAGQYIEQLKILPSDEELAVLLSWRQRRTF